MPERQAIACLLVIALVVSVSAAESVGFVLKSQNAQLRGASVAPGDTVFSGDTISTGAGGSLQISLPGAGVVHMGASSRIRLTKEGLETKLEILANNATFCLTATADASQAQVQDKVVQPVGEKATLEQPNPASSQSQVRAGRSVVTLKQGQCVLISLSEKLPGAAIISGRNIILVGSYVAALITLGAVLDSGRPRVPVSPSRP